MKRISLIFSICLCLLLLSGCAGREKDTSYSLVVRNGSSSEIALKRVAINDKDYLNQMIVLTAPTEKAAGGEYWAVFTAGSTVRVLVVVEDKALGREFTITEKLIDNAGEGYVIAVDYAGDGRAAVSTNTVGRLSVWGQ